MSPLDRALERLQAERQQARATEWSIVLRRTDEHPRLPLAAGVEAFYNVLQVVLGYYDRRDEMRGRIGFFGDEEGRGVLVENGTIDGNPRDYYWRSSRASGVGLPATSFSVDIEDNDYAVATADPELHNELTFTMRSDEPWEAQQRWWQLVVANFEMLGFSDVTLAHWRVIDLLKSLRTLGEIGPMMQFIAIATRHALDDVAAQDGKSRLSIEHRPYIDFEVALSSIAHTAEVHEIYLDDNDMTTVPAALTRFPSLKELHILRNPLPPSERARVATLVPASCKVS